MSCSNAETAIIKEGTQSVSFSGLTQTCWSLCWHLVGPSGETDGGWCLKLLKLNYSVGTSRCTCCVSSSHMSSLILIICIFGGKSQVSGTKSRTSSDLNQGTQPWHDLRSVSGHSTANRSSDSHWELPFSRLNYQPFQPHWHFQKPSGLKTVQPSSDVSCLPPVMTPWCIYKVESVVLVAGISKNTACCLCWLICHRPELQVRRNMPSQRRVNCTQKQNITKAL